MINLALQKKIAFASHRTVVLAANYIRNLGEYHYLGDFQLILNANSVRSDIFKRHGQRR